MNSNKIFLGYQLSANWSVDNINNNHDLPVAQLVKKPPATVGYAGLISVLGRFPGEGNHTPLQYSCLGNSAGRAAWKAIDTELDTTEHAHTQW